MSHKPILCLDFDGVLHSYRSGWQGPRTIPDPPVHGAIEFLAEAVHLFEVHIFSSRSKFWGGRKAMYKWIVMYATDRFRYLPSQTHFSRLRHFLFDYHGVTPGEMAGFSDKKRFQLSQEAARGLAGMIMFPLFKPPAMVTLDDRAITFDGTFPGARSLLSFKPWNKAGTWRTIHEKDDR